MSAVRGARGWRSKEAEGDGSGIHEIPGRSSKFRRRDDIFTVRDIRRICPPTPAAARPLPPPRRESSSHEAGKAPVAGAPNKRACRIPPPFVLPRSQSHPPRPLSKLIPVPPLAAPRDPFPGATRGEAEERGSRD